MSLGLGHKYWVHVIKHHYGDLDSCIKFMNENPAFNAYEFYELRADVRFDEKKHVYVLGYFCDLVEGDFK